jgi:hypothetical protein
VTLADLVVVDRIQVRHAACGYHLRRDAPRGWTTAFCGTRMALPQAAASDAPNCGDCVQAARAHAQGGCQCWKLWNAKARLA